MLAITLAPVAVQTGLKPALVDQGLPGTLRLYDKGETFTLKGFARLTKTEHRC